MARQQIQLPGVVNSQAVASPTSQFVQTQFKEPVPAHIRDIAQFSRTLTGVIAQSQADAHERQMAQGEMDATFSRPFGSGYAPTAENEANRKAWLAAQKRGEILTSEDPWYRIGVFRAEGIRAGQTVHAQLLTPSNIDAASRVFDEQGNWIPPDKQEDAHAIFNRQAALFLNVPALANIYAQRAAAETVNATRGEFVARVARARDAQTQQYHNTQVTDQFVGMLDRVQEASQNQDEDGLHTKAETIAGLHDFVNETMVKGNMPNAPELFRLAGQAFIEKESAKGPDQALAAIDLFREMPIGTTTVGEDNSESGLALRLKLDSEERRFTDAHDTSLSRAANELRASVDIVKIQSEAAISDKFDEDKANGIAPEATWKFLRDANDAMRDGHGTLRGDLIDAALKDRQQAIPDNPGATDELNDRILTKPLDEADAWIQGITGTRVGSTQAKAMHEDVAKAKEWQSDPDFKLASDGFKDDARQFKIGRSSDAQDKIDVLTNAATATANRSIQAQIAGLSLEERKTNIGAIATKAYADAAKPVEALKEELKSKKLAFDIGLAKANAHGQPFGAEIEQGRIAGYLTTDDQTQAINSNDREADISHYVQDPSVVNVLAKLKATPGIGEQIDSVLQADPNKALIAQQRADDWARNWGEKERGKYESRRQADSAFSEATGTQLKAEVLSAFSIKTDAASPVGKAGGPTFDRDAERKAGEGFKSVMQTGNQQLIKATATGVYGMDANTVKPKDQPTAVLDFQTAFGSNPSGVVKARAAARADLGLLQSKSEVHTDRFLNSWNHTVDAGAVDEYKKALLSTGAATTQELLAGSMNVGGVQVPFKPEEINPWRTAMFTSSIQAANMGKAEPVTIHKLATQYGVTDDDFQSWWDQQKLLLKVNGL